DYIARHPDVLERPYRTPTQWDDTRRKRGEEALQRAEAAIATGNPATALDCLDEARAHGVVSRQEWVTTRQKVTGQPRPANPAMEARPPDPPDAAPHRYVPSHEEIAARRAQVRQRQLLLAIEQYAPGYHRITGDGVRYAAEIVKATR